MIPAPRRSRGGLFGHVTSDACFRRSDENFTLGCVSIPQSFGSLGAVGPSDEARISTECVNLRIGGINNLTDERYFTRRAGGYPGPGILPADGRTFYVSAGIKF